MLGNADGDQHGRDGRIGDGHSRSPQRCGYAKPLLRPETRLWPPAALFGGCARVHNLKKRFFPTCYGPEFIAQKVRDWITAVGAKMAYIEPGSPWENGYCESFNARFRDELMNGDIFYGLREAQILIEQWRIHYNTVRPHSSLRYRPPAPESIVPMDQRPTMH